MVLLSKHGTNRLGKSVFEVVKERRIQKEIEHQRSPYNTEVTQTKWRQGSTNEESEDVGAIRCLEG